jgi:hypothetical protein
MHKHVCVFITCTSACVCSSHVQPPTCVCLSQVCVCVHRMHKHGVCVRAVITCTSTCVFLSHAQARVCVCVCVRGYRGIAPFQQYAPCRIVDDKGGTHNRKINEACVWKAVTLTVKKSLRIPGHRAASVRTQSWALTVRHQPMSSEMRAGQLSAMCITPVCESVRACTPPSYASPRHPPYPPIQATKGHSQTMGCVKLARVQTVSNLCGGAVGICW